MLRVWFFFFLVLFALSGRDIVSAQSLEIASQEETVLKPSRIISANFCSDELLIRLADRERIVAITRYSKDQVFSPITDEVKGIPMIRGDAEEIMVLKPDLVFAGPFTRRQTIQFLEKLGVRVVSVPIPKNFDEIRDMIRQMAEVLQEKERGEEIIREINERLGHIARPQSGRSAVFWGIRGSVPGKDTFEHSILTEAGAENIAVRTGAKGHQLMSVETLIVQQPDLIILSDVWRHTRTERRDILNHPAIRKALPGVKVIELPACLLNCGSPRSVEAVEKISGALSGISR
ncbi:MAG: ABC transporter substrate-binding protein [Candidatus Omnitrophica bacterium]|nr:ABC transporter substrate-binding protein [Candidatus Omnitrophota bacterium]